jgi:hypothetical protein
MFRNTFGGPEGTDWGIANKQSLEGTKDTMKDIKQPSHTQAWDSIQLYPEYK